jgi:hypothetical protein
MPKKTEGPVARTTDPKAGDFRQRKSAQVTTAIAAPQALANTCVESRPVYLVELRPGLGVDPIRALRRGLKYLGRRCGLRCVAISERQP